MNWARLLQWWNTPNLDIPTPVPWRPTTDKPTLDAAITRLLDK